MIDFNEVFQQGVKFYRENDFVKAVESFKSILDIDDTNVTVWHNYGLSLLKCNVIDQAIEAFNIAISKGNTESYLSRGASYRSIGKYESAAADFAQCVILEPNNANANTNLGNTLRELGFPQLAMPYLNKALSYDSNNPTYKLNESVAQLLKGDFIAGWKNYDARWFYESTQSFKPNLPGPEYNGTQDLTDKIVCVYCEQGFGDTIQFVRFTKLLEDKGAKILFVTRPELVEFISYNYPQFSIQSTYQNLSYHYHVPLMDLPKCFNTTIDTIPNPEPYLNADDNIVQQYNTLLGPKSKKRIGIVWSSNAIAFTTKFRQVPLEQLIQSLSDYELVNLSYSVTPEEKQILDKYNVKTVEFNGFNQTAGLVKNLDLVVSVDTVYAHLAGAIGVPVYLMLSDYGMDWRWQLHRKDSPFYNSVTIFRQHGDGDWAPVFDEITNQLKG